MTHDAPTTKYVANKAIGWWVAASIWFGVGIGTAIVRVLPFAWVPVAALVAAAIMFPTMMRAFTWAYRLHDTLEAPNPTEGER